MENKEKEKKEKRAITKYERELEHSFNIYKFLYEYFYEI